MLRMWVASLLKVVVDFGDRQNGSVLRLRVDERAGRKVQLKGFVEGGKGKRLAFLLPAAFRVQPGDRTGTNLRGLGNLVRPLAGMESLVGSGESTEWGTGPEP